MDLLLLLFVIQLSFLGLCLSLSFDSTSFKRKITKISSIFGHTDSLSTPQDSSTLQLCDTSSPDLQLTTCETEGDSHSRNNTIFEGLQPDKRVSTPKNSNINDQKTPFSAPLYPKLSTRPPLSQKENPLVSPTKHYSRIQRFISFKISKLQRRINPTRASLAIVQEVDESKISL